MMGSAAYRNPTFGVGNQNVGNMTNSCNNVWNDCEITVSDEKRQILEWLSPMAPRERHQAVCEGRVDRVGSWLLRTNEFKKWHTSDDQAANPVLFCYGDPGVGKTYLSSLVIDELCDAPDEDGVAVACVYCDFHAHKEQSVTGVLAVLLKQLVAGVEPIPEEIKMAFGRAKSTGDSRGLRLEGIHTMLAKSVPSLRRGFICIDALDEFPRKHRPGLWQSLQRIIRECPNIRLFVTGRPHIREEVGEYFPGYPNLDPVEPTKEDIREYLAIRLRKDSELHAMDAELEADILRIIPDKVSGVFLLVSLIMDAILESATKDQRKQTLLDMTKGIGLDDAYSTALGRIREQKRNRGKFGMEALMWISCSERPLKVEELCHALAVKVGAADLNVHDVPSTQTLLSCTLGLVKIDEKESTVRLVHFTLQEYLAVHSNLFTTPHSMMAEICLTYLNFQSVCELSTIPDAVQSAMPFLHYASCYWGFHARREMTKDIKRLALQLLERDANHISADILLRDEGVDLLSWRGRREGTRPVLRGFTGLHCIAYMGVTEIAIDMVKLERWDLNGRDWNGATPLIWAAQYGNSKLIELLLQQRDVNPTIPGYNGRTALSYAAGSGSEDIVKLLLKRKDVKPDFPDKNGRTPLSFAAGSGHESVVTILLEREDVNLGSSDEAGQTPLLYAARSGYEGVVSIFLGRRDANPESSDRNGRIPLSYAAESGHEGIMKLLLERGGVDPNSSDEDGQTPLSYAVRSRHGGVVSVLLERPDVNSNSSGRDGRTPLSYAAGSGSESMVKILLERWDVKPDSSDGSGQTPLLYAARSGHAGIVKMLLERGDVNPGSPDEDGRTPLLYAAISGHEDVVAILLERGDVNSDSSSKSGRTPLSYAAGLGRERLVELLLGRGDVNPDSSGEDGRTSLSHAAEYGHEGVVKILLERWDVNPDSSAKSGRTPLSYAAGSGHGGVARMLLERGGVNPDSLGEDGRTPLSHAAEYGHEDLVMMLLEQGDVNPDSSDKSGRTPLSYAARSRCGGVVKMLLERGDVNPDSSGESGRTPLSFAAGSGDEGVVKLLLEQHDVNPDSLDQYGRTPLSYAARYGRDSVAKILLGQGNVNPDSSDRSNRTPLLYAARFGHEGLVRILLERPDVNPNSPTIYGNTPLSFATQYGYKGVVRLLSEPRPFVHGPSQNSALTQQIPVPSQRPQGAESDAPSQPMGTTPGTRHGTTEAVTPCPGQPPSNRPEPRPSASVPVPIPTSHIAPDKPPLNQPEPHPSASATAPAPASATAPRPATSKPPGLSRYCVAVICLPCIFVLLIWTFLCYCTKLIRRLLCPTKHKNSSPC